MPRKPKQRGRTGTDYRFKIDAYSPATIPMNRLSAYMSQLANMLGETASVHFRELEEGSTVIVHCVDREATPKVRARLTRLHAADAPSDVEAAFNALNKLLREDDAVGKLTAGAVIIPFPGRNEVREELMSVRQQGFVDGIVTGVRGRDETVHITLQFEEKQISGCYTTNQAIAKQLAAKWREPVRLFGKGKWNRDPDGNWTLEDFKIDNFEALDDAPLTDALGELRKIQTEWNNSSFSDLTAMRHGPKGKRNGGH